MPTSAELERLLSQARQIKSLASSFIDTLKPYTEEEDEEELPEEEESSEDASSEEEEPGVNSKPRNLAIILALKKKMKR